MSLVWNLVTALPAILMIKDAVLSQFKGSLKFVPDACSGFDPYLSSKIVGQDLALRQISDAVCDHLASPSPRKPLVLSIHGPPGVGKSLFHQEAARALYSTAPHPDLRCPGPDCAGYKVLFGLDFSENDRQAQHAALRASMYDHMKLTTNGFLIIEEYDKLDCTMRGFFRHLLEGGEVGNISLSRSIVVLESNTGYTSLHGMLKKAGKREKISSEDAQRELKDLVLKQWLAEDCEQRTDTLKMVRLVDFFLPFFPLEKQHIESLFQMRLKGMAQDLGKQRLGMLQWDKSVVDFLTHKVDFEGGFPVEGGKEIGTLMTRHVSRPVREWAKLQENRREEELPVQLGRLKVVKDKIQIVPYGTAV